MKPKTITADLSKLDLMGVELVKSDYHQKVRSHIQRWQDVNDTENERKFTVKKVNEGFLIIRVK